MSLITLLTDFGAADTYVGQVKGAILSVAPEATLVDLTHAVPVQDVQAGAFLLWSAVETFPRGTTHLAVVDPGVGSPRRGVALRSVAGDAFVGPDNGLLIPAVERLGGVARAVELSERGYWRSSISTSSTFHGRDVFGPVTGHLASGVPLERLGRLVQDLERLTISEAQGLAGEIIHIDAYGNLITNLPAAGLPPRFNVRLGDRLIATASYYAAVAPGTLLALVGSAGLLEISARDASAARLTGASRGARVGVEPV